MAIAPNPKRTNLLKDVQANDFISGANKDQISASDDQDSTRKPVVIRIPADLLKRIDQAAKKKSISRSSFFFSSLADLVNGEDTRRAGGTRHAREGEW